MRKEVFVLSAGLFLLFFWACSARAAENPQAIDEAYRRSALEELVSESQREKVFLRRAPNQYSQNPSDHFAIGNGSPLELEPLGPSVGDVVGV